MYEEWNFSALIEKPLLYHINLKAIFLHLVKLTSKIYWMTALIQLCEKNFTVVFSAASYDTTFFWSQRALGIDHFKSNLNLFRDGVKVHISCEGREGKLSGSLFQVLPRVWHSWESHIVEKAVQQNGLLQYQGVLSQVRLRLSLIARPSPFTCVVVVHLQLLFLLYCRKQCTMV